MIDFRSDTVTAPSIGMRQAMADAVVGDDVMGEDPTVNRLEAVASERVAKENALFVPSGTMANLIAILVHCHRGDEAIMGDLAHTFLYEAGGSSALGGVHSRQLRNLPDGTMDLAALGRAIRNDSDIHCPRTRLICIENTHNICGGVPLTADYTARVARIAKEHDLSLHLDGARIFNAAVALGVDVRELTTPADSVSFCLSKGLGAPVGSMLCGTRDFIAEARRMRKVLGGGMRQAGVLAAAGLVAVEAMVGRLSVDHENARRLASGIEATQGFRLSAPVHTNIIFFGMEPPLALTPVELIARLKDLGVLMLELGDGRIRAVTHCDISRNDIDRAIEAIRAAVV
ncbi:MAG: low-specificity L-threonine aldolase [Myxococcota bacterium]|jgi:threonine aldolase